MRPDTGKIKETMKTELREFFDNVGEGKKTNVYNDICEMTERTIIKEALKKTRKNQIKAAQLLGINRNTLKNKMVKYDIHS